MGCGALLSFLAALAQGKNSVQRIGDVFGRGAKPPDSERAPVSAMQFAATQNRTEDLAARHRGRAAALARSSDEDRYGFAPKPPDG